MYQSACNPNFAQVWFYMSRWVDRDYLVERCEFITCSFKNVVCVLFSCVCVLNVPSEVRWGRIPVLVDSLFGARFIKLADTMVHY